MNDKLEFSLTVHYVRAPQNEVASYAYVYTSRACEIVEIPAGCERVGESLHLVWVQ